MERLLEVIKQVRERISKHSAELQKSEALTRYALIDPILRALGWDTEDPDQVRPEFPTETGKPDYALIPERGAAIMVEAKPVNKNLEEARKKGFEYCWRNKCPYFVVTDGDIWEIWDLQKVGGDKILDLKLSADDPGEAARKLLALWRPAASAIKPAPPALVRPEEPKPPVGWITLAELVAQVKPHSKPPRLINFPDGHQEPLKQWKGLLVAVARWVEPKLQGNQLPIKLGKRFLLSSTREHSDGQPFRAPEQVGKFWLETDYFSARDCVRHACRLLEAVGVSPDQVRIES
ncbi:MAG: hypothetical protein ACUVRH_05190 [Candidatus Bipolaricaulia bacterium]